MTMLYLCLLLSLAANVVLALALHEERKRRRWEQHAARALADRVVLLERRRGVA